MNGLKAQDFAPGQVVKCVDPSGQRPGLEQDATYTVKAAVSGAVTATKSNAKGLILEGGKPGAIYRAARFEIVGR